MVLTDTDRDLIAAIQQGLPLASRPYAAVGARLGMSEADVIARLTELQDAGLIKRMGVVVRHRELGYRANAMVVWDVPDNDLERIGRLLAAETCVTLCYQRPRRLPDWPYNLFCMIHGRERDIVRRRLAQIIDYHGLQAIAHSVLFSSRSFKQRGAHYAESAPGLPARRQSYG
jgi:DNA-binding Lrp family transcriptional regulator